jgi:O-methyltransferase domain/Dimerisation domain
MHDTDSATSTLARLLIGANVSRMISVAAELGIADLLADGPRTCDELAAASQTHAPSLYRLLRALASIGIFSEVDDHRFELTPLAQPLRSGIRGSLRSLALLLNDDWFWQLFRDLPYSVRTGEPATEHLWGKSLFAYFAEHPESARVFDEGMASRHDEANKALATGYDFSAIRTLVDVGGGNGSLLVTVLDAHPELRGVLFDLPHVVETAAARLAAAGMAERCSVVGGSFFESVPPGGDAYVLSNVLHDWDDERASTILRNIHRAMAGRGRLLVVNEQVIPPANEPHPGKLGDITMLLIGGRERTEAEWRNLFADSGFALKRIVSLPSRTGVGVIEGEPQAAAPA